MGIQSLGLCGCELAGLRSGPPCPPLRALNKDEKRKLEEVVRTLKSTISMILEEV